MIGKRNGLLVVVAGDGSNNIRGERESECDVKESQLYKLNNYFKV